MSILELKAWYQKNKVHLIIWSIFIFYEILITGIASSYFDNIQTYVSHYAIIIIIFYFHAYVFKKLFKKRIWLTVPFVIFEILMFLIIFATSEFILTNFSSTISYLIKDKIFVARTLWVILYFIGFSTAYVYLLNFLEVRKTAEELEKTILKKTIDNQVLENNLVQSQNNYLRSQINPHFLFNTLNFIYNDARKKAPIAADAIMNLAEMMRYALKRPEVSDMVLIKEEIEQIEYLIQIHNLRTAGAINLKLDIEGDLTGIKFPPLILLTLTENMFKHGHISHPTQSAHIQIVYKDNVLNLSTINMINNTKAKVSTNVGLENIQKRLDSFYKDNYTFTFESDQLNRYITKIQVKLLNESHSLQIH